MDRQTETFRGGRSPSAFVKWGTLGPGSEPMPSVARLLAHTAERFLTRLQHKLTTQARANPFAPPNSFPGCRCPNDKR